MSSRLEKALMANVGPSQRWFIHTPTPGMPTAPSIAGLNPQETDQFNSWLSLRMQGSISAGETVAAYLPNVQAMIQTYETTYFNQPAFMAWSHSDMVQREMQWRLAHVDAGAAVQNLGTLPVSLDPTGVGANAPFVSDVNSITRSKSGITVTIASPAVVTWTNHNLTVGRPVTFSTTGTLPTGLNAGQVYYVQSVIDANTFRVSSVVGGAAVNTSGSQSGTQSVGIVAAMINIYGGGNIDSGLYNSDIYQVPAGVELHITDFIVSGYIVAHGYNFLLILSAYSLTAGSKGGFGANLLNFYLKNQDTTAMFEPVNLQRPLTVPGGLYINLQFPIVGGTPPAGNLGHIWVNGYLE